MNKGGFYLSVSGGEGGFCCLFIGDK